MAYNPYPSELALSRKLAALLEVFPEVLLVVDPPAVGEAHLLPTTTWAPPVLSSVKALFSSKVGGSKDEFTLHLHVYFLSLVARFYF